MLRQLVARVVLVAIFLHGSGRAGAEGRGVVPDTAATPQQLCSDCHSCPRPSLDGPCLIRCPRVAAHRGPEVVLLDELSDQYVPVIFAHALHADMTGMTEGCVICHHHSPSDVVTACRECHGNDRGSGSFRQPSLKGAYHRQCLNCHREWSHETQCSVCHAKKSAGSVPVEIPDATDIMGILHPNIEEPDIKLYRTEYPDGEMVTFRHHEHVNRFSLQCVDCHREQSCSRCHDADSRIGRAPTLEEHHAPCSDCHDTVTEDRETCFRCHASGETPPFTHETRTGWPLRGYHEVLSCQSCHPQGPPFTPTDSECHSCHSGWSSGNFNHATTGLALDENHLDWDCIDCHLDNRFDQKPSCQACHEDDVTYPEAAPGEYPTPKAEHR